MLADPVRLPWLGAAGLGPTDTPSEGSAVPPELLTAPPAAPVPHPTVQVALPHGFPSTPCLWGEPSVSRVSSTLLLRPGFALGFPAPPGVHSHPDHLPPPPLPVWILSLKGLAASYKSPCLNKGIKILKSNGGKETLR